MEVKAQPQNKFERLINDSEFNRFGLICVILTIVGCLGGIAVGLGAINNVMALTAVIIPTMATLSLLLAVSPMRWIMSAAIVSVSLDLFLILYYTLA
ncbi:MAG: hypothetical protein RI922_629 [Bacteroidota bacterium]|jgi:hypothetical protein